MHIECYRMMDPVEQVAAGGVAPDLPRMNGVPAGKDSFRIGCPPPQKEKMVASLPVEGTIDVVPKAVGKREMIPGPVPVVPEPFPQFAGPAKLVGEAESLATNASLDFVG